jgi:hypothetical protein
VASTEFAGCVSITLDGTDVFCQEPSLDLLSLISANISNSVFSDCEQVTIDAETIWLDDVLHRTRGNNSLSRDRFLVLEGARVGILGKFESEVSVVISADELQLTRYLRSLFQSST